MLSVHVPAQAAASFGKQIIHAIEPHFLDEKLVLPVIYFQLNVMVEYSIIKGRESR